METSILTQANKAVKRYRPSFPTHQVCQIFHTDNLLEIGFLSKQCRNDLRGSCIMCDYGCADGTREDSQYLAEMKDILVKYEGAFQCLLICTNGSFMDEFQIPDKLFREILLEASRYNIPEIEIETHYQNITMEKLDYIRSVFPNQTVLIELGLETLDPAIQDKVIMKNIDLERMESVIALIQQHGFFVELNIMIGLPFLSAKEQLEDAIQTVEWAISRNCKPVVFPINIKPYTLLMHMHRTGHYSPISHWLLVLLLDSIDEKFLNMITLAWYGNREERYESSERAVFPTSCACCLDSLMIFYQDFNEKKESKMRKNLIRSLLENKSCNCLEHQLEQIKSQPHKQFFKNYQSFINALQTNFPSGDSVI